MKRLFDIVLMAAVLMVDVLLWAAEEDKLCTVG